MQTKANRTPPISVFRLRTPTLGIIQADDGHRIAIRIPSNALIKVTEHQIIDADERNWDKLIDVQWEEKTITMFEQDIHQRCDRVK